jgi:micrococcal nuclease
MYKYRAKLRRVVDGDTVDVTIDLGFSIYYDCRIRLKGINAPESRTKDLKEKAKGIAAKERLQELLESDELIIRTHLDETGKYGRVLGKIYIGCNPWLSGDMDRVCVNDVMINEGHAVPYIS